MIKIAKRTAKHILAGDTLRLFTISAVCFILRYSALFGCAFSIYTFLKSNFLNLLIETYGEPLIISGFVLLSLILAFLCLAFISAIKLGESYVYFIKAQGGYGRFLLLFKFLNPKISFKTFYLYALLNIKKLLWLLYFLVPCLICASALYYTYSLENVPSALPLVLSFAASLIFSMSFVVWRFSTIRYSCAPYYLSANRKMKLSKAIIKSIRLTDSHLSDAVFYEYSILGWVLCCFFILPMFYAVPYMKLSKAVLILKFADKISTSNSKYAVNILKILPN